MYTFQLILINLALSRTHNHKFEYLNSFHSFYLFKYILCLGVVLYNLDLKK